MADLRTADLRTADLRTIASPFVALGPSGVAVRDRLKGLTAEDEKVLWLVGEHLGSLACRDLKARCADGPDHDNDKWAARKRELTAVSSSRWAGSITKATHDQWALARRGLGAHIHSLEAGIGMLRHRLSLPVGEKGSKRFPGGYRSRAEWFAKSRRLCCLQDRHAKAVADWRSGRVRVVRGGKRLARGRHNLAAAGLSVEQWRARWQAERLLLSADGESGKRFGNETIRITDTGEVSIKLPSPLAQLANASHGRYVLACRISFPHRGEEWRERIEVNRAVAYTIHHDPQRGRWYVSASWRRAAAPVIALEVALASGCIGVDTNDDHLAAWRLDAYGNPVGEPKRFLYNLSGSADHRDAQIRHALTCLLHWADRCGVRAIAVEDLDFERDKTREKHGRRKRFRRLISRFPTAKLKARLISMAAEVGISVIGVDPAYTSKWGAEHWQKPLTTGSRTTTRHDAASIVIGRRAQGHPARRRTAPPRNDQSDRRGHRTVQAEQDIPGREETRPHLPGPRPGGVSPTAERKRETSASNTVGDTRTERVSLPLSV
jgi:IS605 OrfB family transposase